jgi:hypothetical protein
MRIKGLPSGIHLDHSPLGKDSVIVDSLASNDLSIKGNGESSTRESCSIREGLHLRNIQPRSYFRKKIFPFAGAHATDCDFVVCHHDALDGRSRRTGKIGIDVVGHRLLFIHGKEAGLG